VAPVEPGDRGRAADQPTDIPARGWKDVLARVRAEAKEDNISLLSAGVAFYGLLAMAPGLVALLSVYALVSDPGQIRDQVVRSLSAAPREVRDLVSSQLSTIAAESGGSALVATIVGIAVALWAASSGVSHLVEALNVAYDEVETRGWVRRKLIALSFTLGGVVFLVVAFAGIALLPTFLDDIGLGPAARVVVNVSRWVVLFGGMIVALALIYRYGPDRDEPKWRWVSSGALVAAAMWSIGSIGFSIYAANFGKYNETYGSLSAIVVVMLWLYLTALSVIVGAELNAELEKQTVVDTTVGPDRPLGERDAAAADTVGETAAEVKRREAAEKAAKEH
jgi:membrane protein